MSLKLVFILLAITGVVGIAAGYFLRWLVALSKKGSMELEIKQKMLEADDNVKKIMARAEKDAEKKVEEKLGELKDQEDKAKKTEDRLIKKEELLDKRQTDIDAGSRQSKRKD